MKILHVIPSYEPAWAFGGTVTATSQLCRVLAKNGIDVTIYTTDADGKGGYLNVPLNQPVDLGGVKVWYFHCTFGAKKAFYSKKLTYTLRKNIKNFNLIHISTIWQWIGIDAYRICKKNNIPYIVTPHSSLMEFAFCSVGSYFLKNLYWKFFGQNLIKKASAIQFLCEGERKESSNFLNSTQSFIVPNGIEYNKFTCNINKRIELRRKFNISKEAMVLLFLGRIHPKKQLDLIIKAFPSILEYRKDVFLIVAGPVEDEKYFKNLNEISKEIGIDSNILWVGPINNQEVLCYYSASDIMVLPSIVEGISMAIVEAMAASLPVLISNRVANYREVEIDKAGIIVEPDFNSVKNAFINICNNSILLNEMSQNARKSVENRYDINKVVSLMIKAYTDILSNKRSPELQWK